MADPLDRYRAMRDFDRTTEPSGDGPVADATPGGDQGARFVVQEHHATALHWDLRLERDGVLASWAVPKGIPPDPREDHLAVHTEDHPLLYLDFAGTIPEGEYGAGLMRTWDSGTYECHKWDDREVQVTLRGERAIGRYVLFHTGGRNWMLHRMGPPADPSRLPMPASFSLVDVADGPLPGDQDAWSFEAALGGRRVVVASEGGRARVLDGAAGDVSQRWPEARPLGRELGAVEVAVEAELVVSGADGRPDPGALGRRAAAAGSSAVQRLAARHPAAFVATDLLWLEGHDTTGLDFGQRRALLEKLAPAGPAWQVTVARPGQGTVLLEASRAQGLAGVRARRLGAAYEAGAVRFIPVAGSTRPAPEVPPA